MRKCIAGSGIGVVFVLAACSGPKVDLGGQLAASRSTPSSDGGIAPSAGGEGLSAAKRCALVAPADAGGLGSQDAGADWSSIVGTWRGYVEAYSFGSGSDALVVVFSVQPDGGIKGTILFGNEPVPRPPTSGDAAYPPGTQGWGLGLPYEGFPYTAVQVLFDGTRLRFGAVGKELWKTWCALQTSYDWGPRDPGNCGCYPNWPGGGSNDVCQIQNPDTGELVPIACVLIGACGYGNVCDCTAGSCSVEMSMPGTIIDVRLTPGRLDGTITNLPTSPSANVHFTLSP